MEVGRGAKAFKQLGEAGFTPLTPAEQSILSKRQQDQAILKQPPNAENFIPRIKALSNLYGDVKQ
jgi:hypothetical protein